MSGSPIDGVLTALVAAYKAAAPVGVKVFDSEPVDPPRRFLCVGWDESTEPQISATSAPSDASAQQLMFDISVPCLLSCWAGNLTGRALRSEASGLFAVLDAALAADRYLGGAAMLAYVSDQQYVQEMRSGANGVVGELAQFRFTLRVQAMQ